MLEFIGEKLEVVLAMLEKKGMAYKVFDNNFSVNGDTKLVTNIIAKDDIVEITIGNFIFDVRNKKDEL